MSPPSTSKTNNRRTTRSVAEIGIEHFREVSIEVERPVGRGIALETVVIATEIVTEKEIVTETEIEIETGIVIEIGIVIGTDTETDMTIEMIGIAGGGPPVLAADVALAATVAKSAAEVVAERSLRKGALARPLQ